MIEGLKKEIANLRKVCLISDVKSSVSHCPQENMILTNCIGQLDEIRPKGLSKAAQADKKIACSKKNN